MTPARGHRRCAKSDVTKVVRGRFALAPERPGSKSWTAAGTGNKQEHAECEVTAREQRADRHVTAREQHVHESCGSEGKVSSACRQQQRAVVAGTWSALFFLSGLTRKVAGSSSERLLFPGSFHFVVSRRKPAEAEKAQAGM